MFASLTAFALGHPSPGGLKVTELIGGFIILHPSPFPNPGPGTSGKLHRSASRTPHRGGRALGLVTSPLVLTLHSLLGIFLCSLLHGCLSRSGCELAQDHMLTL